MNHKNMIVMQLPNEEREQQLQQYVPCVEEEPDDDHNDIDIDPFLQAIGGSA